MSQKAVALVAVAVLAGSFATSVYAECSVPGTHTSIQDAVDDTACSSIILAAQDYQEAVEVRRTLEIRGPSGGGAVVKGRLVSMGGGVQLQLVNLAVHTGCDAGIQVTAGATMVGEAVTALKSFVSFPCPALPSEVFQDGFESGSSSQWSSTVGDPQ